MSIRLKDLQHGGAEHSLAMFSAAEYEAIELAADGLMESITVADGDVIHTPTPLKGSCPETGFSARKDVMNPSVGLELNSLGIGARKVLSHSSVSATTAHLGLASMTAGEEIEANDQAEQHGEADVPLTCAMLSVSPTTARTLTNNPNFDVIKGCQFLIAGT